ncbi:MAG: cation:proton antiporter [Thiohalophilus sp.]
MDLLDIAAVLLVLMAGFGYLNQRYLHLPTTLGMLLVALVAALFLALMLGFERGGLAVQVQGWLRQREFHDTLLSALLGLLLFAGALRLNLADLAQQKWLVLSLVLFGVTVSVLLVGTLGWVILAGLGVTLPWLYGLLFGALIAPTDPIVVRGLLARAGVPPTLQTRMAGESVLGGGLAIAVFVVLLATVSVPASASPGELLLQQVGGSLLFGLVIGLLAYQLLRRIDHYQIEVLIMLSLVAGGLVVASHWRLSGPLALLIAGLVLGNHGQLLAMSEKSRRHLHDFWELIGALVNAVLLVLLILEIMLAGFRGEYLLAALAILPIVLLARLLGVGLPIAIMRYFRSFSPGTIQLMSWGGLRGGVSIALVLSLPAGMERDTLVVITAAVVVFSVVVQGLTFATLVRRLGE